MTTIKAPLYEYIAVSLKEPVATPTGQATKMLFMREDIKLSDEDHYIELGDMIMRADNIVAMTRVHKDFKFDYDSMPSPYRESPVTIAQV